MRCLDEFIRESELIDLPLNHAYFTWLNLQVVPICKRLDRFFFSNEWECTFPQSRQEDLPRWDLDHNPISLHPDLWGLTPFRFENMWLLLPDFKERFMVVGKSVKRLDGKVIDS